jgi:hypothetical protein
MPQNDRFAYEVQIPISASRPVVWGALVHETNDWWPADARMVSPTSVVSLDLQPGGALIEVDDGAGSLLWYSVQMCRVGHSLELAGDLGALWGGPARSLLSLALEEGDEGTTVLTVRDAHIGDVSASTIASLEEGWTMIFGQGLKSWVER